MNLFGFTIGKEKPMTFLEFREHVRLILRKTLPGVQFEHREYGFVLVQKGQSPITCNLRRLYAEYCKKPEDRDRLVDRWMQSLTVEIPAHTWLEAQWTLRPVLKNADYILHAGAHRRSNAPNEIVPHIPFAGELSTIVMRELPGTVVAVTQRELDEWNIAFDQAVHQAVDNMNMKRFPTLAKALYAGSPARKGATEEELGLVFEGDHLTASWLVIARFRDYLAQRLQGDFVAFAPTRSQLTAVRADEPGLIAQTQARCRTAAGQPHWLSAQGMHVSGATTGGVVSIYKDAFEMPIAGPASRKRNFVADEYTMK